MGQSTTNVTLGHLFPAIEARLDQALGTRWTNARPQRLGELRSLKR